MKKIIFTLAISLCLFYFNNSFSQNYNWITPNKTYLKMYIADDGMYRINKIDFTNAGINADIIDPRTVKVYNKGNQLPAYFQGEADGIFDAADYLDFYGTRNSGGLTTTFDQNNYPVYTTNEYYNQYSDTNVYWLDWGGSFGTRYSVSNYNSSLNYPNLYFNETLHFEKDIFYSQGEVINGSDLRFLSTEKFKGEAWYWTTLSDNQVLSDTFSLPFLFTTEQNASIRVFAYPTNRNTSVFNEHTLRISVNGTLITTLASNDMNRIDATVTFSSSLLSNTLPNTVAIQYVPAPGASGSMYIDLFEVQYPKTFNFRNNIFSANLGGLDSTSKLFGVGNYSSTGSLSIYDVYNNIKINSSSVNLGTLQFTGKSNGKFEIVNNIITKKPLRIKQKQVPDLTSRSNEADYLIIYPNSFENAAERLRSYREGHDNFRSFKAEIEDIYDVFNYGIESPSAVRNFTKYAYINWQSPALGYICLLGRASLDPKKLLSNSEYYKNIIPTYGVPPSDGYFANFNTGTFCYYDMVAIGRLPAYSSSEAQTMVDKIIAYENQKPAGWSKDFIYITGGGTLSEQSQHQSKSNFEIGALINPPSLSGRDHKIYRNDTPGSETFNLKDSVTNDISRGSLFLNFRGHAGSHDWEVALNDPNTLSNGSKLPLVLSLTCFTGENARPEYRGFGEQFVYLNNKGAIAFVGTTGWSYSQSGNDFGSHMLQTMKSDNKRRVGDLTKYAHKQMSIDSLSFSVRHTLNCYTLLGDPATTLNLPAIPELSIQSTDYKLSNNFPTVGDNVALTIYPKNYGTNCDSTKIRFQLKKNNIVYSYKDSVIKNLGYTDSITYNFRLDSIGNYSATITLDQNNWIPLEDKSNNILKVNIPVKNMSFVPLKPVSNSIVNSDSVEFVGLNPRITTTNNSISVILQLDSSYSFDSPIIKTFVNSSITGVSTKFKTSVPFPVNNNVFYWRTNSVINGDSTGWSSVQNFVYNSEVKSSSISSSSNLRDDYSSVPASITIVKNTKNQYSQTDFNNTESSQGGIELSNYTANLYIRSYGSNAEQSSYFSIGSKNIYIDGGVNSGLNVVKVKKLTGTILGYKNYKMLGPSSSDSMETFLNTFDSSQYLMLLNAAYVDGGSSLSASLKTKLRQFGSIYCDSISITGYFHSWSLIGYLGAAHSRVSEMFDPCCRSTPYCASCDHWSESVSFMNVVFKKTSGTLSSIYGPAQTWTDFSWTQVLNSNSSLKFDIYGIDVNNNQTLILSNLQNSVFNDLRSINAYQYPKLNLVAKFDIDTNVGNLSSILNSLKLNYIAPSEFTWNINSLSSSSSYRVGDELKFAFDYYNPGYSSIPGIIVNVYKKNIYAPNLILSDTTSYTLTSDSFKLYKNKFTVPNFTDSLKMIIQIKLKGQNNEYYSYNNNVEFSMSKVHADNPVNVIVYSDGQVLNNGDFVSPNPEIKINLSNPELTGLLTSDTTQLMIHMNDKYIPYFISGKINPELKIVESDNPGQGNENSILFYPKLTPGKHKLSLIYYSDPENRDSVNFDVLVTDELAVKDLYNYPNPMKGETNFIFSLAGSLAPGKFKIKIYTVSGKLIKQINYAVNIGYNQIPWDGRDDDGDLVANGTYLYKLMTEDDSKFITQTEKLVVLR
ncbi:MAG: C25 family cysteine peptidase [bacterium]